MNDRQGKTTRRSFFVNGGALIGAGVAAAGTALAGATPTTAGNPAGEREAIRALHARFLRHVEAGEHAAAAALFDSRARLVLTGPEVRGERAIREFLAAQATPDATVFHTAYRRSAAQADDAILIEESGTRATATFLAEAELCTPLAATCTAAQMARLQGNVSNRHWQSGRFDARYVKDTSGWKIAELRWSTA
jgi:hypothetical protein